MSKGEIITLANSQVLVRDLNEFLRKKGIIKSGGKDDCYVISDFDRTLTYGMLGGKKTPSIISLLRDGNHLSSDYAEKAHELFDYYHPFENDFQLSLDERKEKMQQWWKAHDELLLSSGLKLDDLKDIVDNGYLRMRDGVFEFLSNLKNWNIPIYIFSASGCGDAIPLFFEKNQCGFANIMYIINRFSWNKSGEAIGINGEIIHSLNKNEGAFSKDPSLNKRIKGRSNVIVIGDGLGDSEMAYGAEAKNILKIGILTMDSLENRELYSKAFDIVILGDGDFSAINKEFYEMF